MSGAFGQIGSIARAAVACVIACAPAIAPARAAECRQALAIGLDVSGSVDRVEYRMQVGGLSNALMHPDVRQAILSMPSAPIRLFIFEWSGERDQHILLPWTEIATAGDLDAVIALLQRQTRLATAHTTAIGSAMLMGARSLAEQSTCWKRTLDLTGDGKSNGGPRPRDVTLSGAADVTVNALVIGTVSGPIAGLKQGELAELVAYFQSEVIRGADAFTEVALGFQEFEQAMIRKLLKELQGLSVSGLAPPREPG